MARVDMAKVLSALEELGDREAQRRLWLSTGLDGAEVSSFVEAVETLFTDSGLSYALEWAWRQRLGGRLDVVDTPVFSEHIDGLLTSLGKLTRCVERGSTERLIDDPQMTLVRSAALELIEALAPLSGCRFGPSSS